MTQSRSPVPKRYRLKQAVEAVQITEEMAREYLTAALNERPALPFAPAVTLHSGTWHPEIGVRDFRLCVRNSEWARQTAYLNDWLVIGPEGVISVWAPQMFEATYELEVSS